MFTSGLHCVQGSGSVEVEMYTSETGKDTEIKLILFNIYPAISWWLGFKLIVTPTKYAVVANALVWP